MAELDKKTIEALNKMREAYVTSGMSVIKHFLDQAADGRDVYRNAQAAKAFNTLITQLDGLGVSIFLIDKAIKEGAISPIEIKGNSFDFKADKYKLPAEWTAPIDALRTLITGESKEEREKKNSIKEKAENIADLLRKLQD